jgi:ABC-2 type transport system permease protein
MGRYWYIFRLVWIEQMAYRVNFLLEIGSITVSQVIVVFLWLAIYRSAQEATLGGYSAAQMVTYLLGGGFINSFLLTTAENPETSQSIQEGTFSNLLLQPISPYTIWFLRDLGIKAFLSFFGLAGFGLVCIFFGSYVVFPPSIGCFFMFLIALFTAALIQFLLFEVLSLLGFWLENTYGIRFTMRVIMEVAGGAIIPLSFFSSEMRATLRMLPFQYLMYFPMNVYLGKISSEEITFAFLEEAAWIFVLAVGNWLVWKKGIRQYVAMGD